MDNFNFVNMHKSLAEEQAQRETIHALITLRDSFEEDAGEEEETTMNEFSKDVAEYLTDILKNIEKAF